MAAKDKIVTLTSARLRFASRWLAARDAALKDVLDEYGYPEMWNRNPGFSTMAHIILEQQVSLASANATLGRLEAILNGKVTPEGVIRSSDDELSNIGITRQKKGYLRLLAQQVCSGTFSFESLDRQTDDQVRKALTRHKGIGMWSADIYLSECLLRCDVLPKGDVGVQEAYRVLKRLEVRPSHETLEMMTQHWRPWRSVGTRMLWLFYLSRSAGKCDSRSVPIQ